MTNRLEQAMAIFLEWQESATPVAAEELLSSHADLEDYLRPIVICALNEEARIQDAILSAKQNGPTEVIVIEGGSTDRTFELASRYADRALQVSPFNLGHKRNVGVNVASQRYILNMDADQYARRVVLEQLV